MADHVVCGSGADDPEVGRELEGNLTRRVRGEVADVSGVMRRYGPPVPPTCRELLGERAPDKAARSPEWRLVEGA
jgi:hypothetical protein